MRNFLLLFFLMSFGSILGQTPSETKKYASPTTYQELSEFLGQIVKRSKSVTVETIGKSAQDRSVFALKFSSSRFGSDPSKLKVLLFAQQHGNEQSGKDGALLLADELIKPENQYLLNHLDIAIVPQVNPDGSEINRRRNGHSADLNRNHLILEEPEVIALHHFFDQYQFEMTLDVHEYAPFGETWKKYGYRCNSDELIGCNTNCNIPESLRKLANTSFVPFWRNYLTQKKFSNSIYAPGGPPELEYIRHSTFDINDGRQSFGIQNSFSFIQEGLNGFDNFKDSLQHRAEGQKTGMRALLEFAYTNHKTIIDLVKKERQQLILGHPVKVAIQMEHIKNGTRHPLPVYSYSTGKDSIIMVKDYRPVVSPITEVIKPAGYLIPTSDVRLMNWAKRHGFTFGTIPASKHFAVEQYEITKIDSMDFEGDQVVNPEIKTTVVPEINPSDYLYLPTNQVKGNLIVIALEPKSELGLVTYPGYAYLLKKNSRFPVLRLVKTP